MVALLVVFFFAAVLIGTGIAFGGAVLAVLLVLAALLVVGWGVLAFVSGRSVSDVVEERSSEREDFLGPGGPDDPGHRTP